MTTPPLFCGLAPTARQAFMVLCPYDKFPVGAFVVVAVGSKLEERGYDEINGLAFQFIEGPADAIERVPVGRQGRRGRVVVVEQKPVSAMLDERQVRGVAEIVAGVVGIPGVRHWHTPRSHSGSPVTGLRSFHSTGFAGSDLQGSGCEMSRNQECRTPSTVSVRFSMLKFLRSSKILALYCAAHAMISGSGTQAPRASISKRRISARCVLLCSGSVGTLRFIIHVPGPEIPRSPERLRPFQKFFSKLP